MAIQIDGDSGVSGVNGSATTPALQGTDSNTGIVFGADTVQIATGGSTRATVDSSGNVGINQTPTRELSLHSPNNNNSYIHFTNDDTGETSSDGALVGIDGNEDLNINNQESSKNIILRTGGSERARLDSDGRLLVATSTAPSVGSFASTAKLVSQGNTTESVGGAVLSLQRGEAATAITSGEYLGNICFTDNAGSEFARIDGLADGSAGSSDYPGRLAFLTTADGASSPTERMRITSGGFLCIGGTSTVAGAKLGITFAGATQNGIGLQTTYSGTGSDYIRFNNSAGNQAGEISQSGTTSVSYTTSSDYRLKENVVDIADGIARVKQLAPKRFNFIEDGPDKVVDGFLAHEAQTVVPEAVTGTHNQVQVWNESEELPEGVSVGDNKLDEEGNTIPEYQGIDQSKLVPLLTAALQEAIGKIETLETQNADLLARVTALEAA